MIHYLYRSGNSAFAPVLLLHSTGGDETELLQLAEMLAPEHPTLSIRGSVSENGLNRYFARYAEGKFNLDSLKVETERFFENLLTLSAKFHMDLAKMWVIGYSNGANMALHVSLTKPAQFAKIIAFHAMQLTEVPVNADKLAQTEIFLTHGESDSIVPEGSFTGLIENLKNAGAVLQVHRENGGHQMTRSEIHAAQNFLEDDL